MVFTHKRIKLNTIITLFSKHLLTFMVGLFCLLPVTIIGGMAPDLDGDFLNEMTKTMEDIQKDPVKRAEFEETVKEMEKAIQAIGGDEAFLNMNEADMTDFLTNFASQQEEKKKKVKEAPKPVVKEVAPAPVIPLSGKELLLDNINTIINYINSFFSKVPAMPELPGEIERWSKEGLVTEWGPAAKWNSIKKSIELLQNKLYTIIAIDKKTDTRRYLGYIYENESLKNHLQLLKVKLADSEPFINVDTFSFDKFGEQSKKATQKTLNSLGESIQKLKIIDSINSAIEKYDPTAKKIREEEEALKQKAEQEAKKKPTPSRAVHTQAPKMHHTAPKHKKDDSYWPGSSYYDDYPSHTSTHTPARKSSSRSTPSKTTPADASKKTSKDAAKKEEKKDEKKGVPTEHDIKIKKLINTFQEEIDTIDQEFRQNALMTKLTETAEGESFSPLVKESFAIIEESLRNAAKAAEDLYNTASDPKVYTKTITEHAKKIDYHFNTMKKKYNTDKLEKELMQLKKKLKATDQARKKQTAAYNRVIDVINADIAQNPDADEKEIKERHEESLERATELFNAAKEKLKEATFDVDEKEKDIAAATPDVLKSVFKNYNNLQRKVKRFSRKSIAPTTVSTPPTGATSPAVPLAPVDDNKSDAGE